MFATLATAARSLVTSFNAWREREKALAELTSLDDRVLADIGISRSQIDLAVAGRLAAREEASFTPVYSLAANTNSGKRFAA